MSYNDLSKLYAKPYKQNELPVENRIFFIGNSDELENAITCAIELGIKVGIDNDGKPFVNGSDNYERVASYLCSYKVPGYYHYKWVLEEDKI